MNTTAFVIAAGDSASSGWFEGWIGGLIAAAVTISATIWWESRTRRRSHLEQELLAMVEAAHGLRLVLIKRDERSSEAAIEVAEGLNALGARYLNVIALTSRKVIALPSKWVAPTRAGLSRTLDSLWDGLEEHMGGLGTTGSPEQWTSARDGVVREVGLLTSATLAWLSNPWLFWNKDLAGRMRSNRERRVATGGIPAPPTAP